MPYHLPVESKREAKLFKGTVVLKGLDGLLEIISGLLLLAVSPAWLNRLASIITQDELSRDPHDFVATHILHSAQSLTGGSIIFASLYLLAHGFIKIILVAGLLKRQLWSYPASLIFLSIFIIYQTYRFALTYSIAMAFLTVFDLLVMWLIWREYRRLKGEG